MSASAASVADGVWRVTRGFPLRMNVFLIREGDGVAVFDAGHRPMGKVVREAAAALGGAVRVVLGNAHPDHRGGAGAIGAPVHCHPDERADVEGDGGAHYFDYSKLSVPARWAYPRLLPAWDGGPVEIAGTVEEGDDVSGFRVVHIPGHSPGQIALFRESDRVALTADCFYTIDPTTGRHGRPRVPLAAFNLDTEQARASVRKVAALEPSVAWPGHADPVTGDVRAVLERAAAET